MKRERILTLKAYSRWIGLAAFVACAVPSWSTPTTEDEIIRETNQITSAASKLSSLYSDVKDAYDAGTKLLQAIGWIKTDPDVSQQINELQSRDNKGFAGAVWTVDANAVQTRLANLQTAIDELTHGTTINKDGNADYWSADALNYFADDSNYPDSYHSTNGVFYRQWTDADQKLLNLLNQNGAGLYSKADFDPQSATTDLVYDWRMGVPALMTAVAMRVQILAAIDPNFRTSGQYSDLFLRYRRALQWHYNMMLKGIKCGPYSAVCADVHSGIQFPTRDAGTVQATIGAFAPGRYAVQAAMPLYEVKAMIDLMYIYANPVSPDLTENYHRLVSAQSPNYCVEARPSTVTGVKGLFPVVNVCTSSGSQQWIYNRKTGQISNSGTLAQPGSGGCLAAGANGDPFSLTIAACSSDRLQRWTFDQQKQTILNANGTFLRTDTSVFAAAPNYVSGYAMLTSPPAANCICNSDSQKWLAEGFIAGRTPFTDRLGSGASMSKGQMLTSTSNDFEVDLGGDGDLSFYHKASQFPDPQRFDLIWDSRTAGKGVTGMSMQKDGNLTIAGTPAPCIKSTYTFCDPGPALPGTVWSSGTGGNPGASLKVDDDGNLAIHNSSAVLWENGYLTLTVYVLDPESAAFVTQVLPATMLPGQHYNVSITMRNTSNHTWTAASGFRLASADPADNMTWGVRRADLPGPVAPGATVTFNFQVIAPQAPGVWPFQWQMIREGAGTFGSPSALVLMPVVNPVTDDARFVIQSLPTTMTAGQRYDVAIRMRNSGLSVWTTAAGYNLLPQRPQGNSLWGTSSVSLPATLASVAPNGEVIFNFPVIAPSTPGSYVFEWRMAHNNLGFGDFSPAVTINVVK